MHGNIFHMLLFTFVGVSLLASLVSLSLSLSPSVAANL